MNENRKWQLEVLQNENKKLQIHILKKLNYFNTTLRQLTTKTELEKKQTSHTF